MACFWATAAYFERDSNNMWMRAQDIEDEDIYTRYLASFYWAVTTATTIGYGDITPTNEFERFVAAGVIMIGVAYYSFIISDLSQLWNIIASSSSTMSKKEMEISNFATKH